MKTSFAKTVSPCNAPGFTLIELLIGISLGVVILGGILAVYIPTVKSWNATASLAQIHDTESIVHDIFGTSIRQAGLLACGSKKGIIDGTGLDSTNKAKTANWALSSTPADFLKTSFRAYPADTSGLDTIFAAAIKDNRLFSDDGSTAIGDIFFVLAPSRGYFRVTAHDAIGKTLSISSYTGNINIKAGEFLIVNDCDNPTLIRANASIDQNSPAVLNYTNSQPTEIEHNVNTVINVFEPAIYYLREKSNVPTLYKATIRTGTTPLELIHTPILSGVENLRVEYGVADSNGDYIEEYKTAKEYQGDPDVTHLDDVLSVRVSVMIQAPGGNSTQSKMKFPNLKGVDRYCFKDGESTKDGFKDACPDFLSASVGGAKTHKVIQFVYILPRIISI